MSIKKKYICYISKIQPLLLLIKIQINISYTFSNESTVLFEVNREEHLLMKCRFSTYRLLSNM